MRVSLRKRVATTQSLLPALQIIAGELQACGALTFRLGSTRGALTFSNGRVNGAFIHPNGPNAMAAIELLLNNPQTAVRYRKYLHKTITSQQEVDVGISQLIDRLSPPNDALLVEYGQARCAEVIENAEQAPDRAAAPSSAGKADAARTAAPQPEIPLATAFHWPEAVTTLPVSEAIGVIFLGLLVAALFLAPSRIRESATNDGSRHLVRQNLTNAIYEYLLQDQLKESRKVQSANQARHLGQTPGQGEQNDGEPSEAAAQELLYAQRLVADGKKRAAIPYLEGYSRLNPRSIQPRIELINLYLENKELYKARHLCIQSFKLQPNSEQLGQIWHLLSQCQTD